jgi:hypothetical protein
MRVLQVTNITIRILTEYDRLTSSGTAYLSRDLKVALLAWATIIIQVSYKDDQTPISVFNEAYEEAYKGLFEKD